jgi:hypothetical protein
VYLRCVEDVERAENRPSFVASASQYVTEKCEVVRGMDPTCWFGKSVLHCFEA